MRYTLLRRPWLTEVVPVGLHGLINQDGVEGTSGLQGLIDPDGCTTPPDLQGIIDPNG